MPGWHEATRRLQEQGRVQMIGIIQEQHPDRCRLFMQWKRMDWPILVDTFNELGVAVVPITLFIDENGIIRKRRPRLDDLEAFLSEPPPHPRAAREPTRVSAPARPVPQAPAAMWREHADHLAVWGSTGQLGESIAAYREALTREPDHAPTHFRLGAALRRRYDSELRRAGDFQQAVNHWRAALDLDPNQYIWRRRIQQYGPRLDKPYPFYDWVRQARTEIQARGETPAALPVEPRGAEFARPLREFEIGSGKSPDPQGRIHRDQEGLIEVETAVVPPRLGVGESARVHVVLRPNLGKKAHWNNEVDELVLWVEAPPGWHVDNPLRKVPLPPRPVSQETRQVEFEIYNESALRGAATLRAYALYYVCEDVDGTCLYRRQDIPVTVEAGPAQ